MIWAKSGRMHWTSYDVAGLMLDVEIVNGTALLKIVDASTGEITRTLPPFDHPIDAMNAAKFLYTPIIEAKHVETRKDERKETESPSYTPNPEETCTIQEGNRLPC